MKIFAVMTVAFLPLSLIVTRHDMDFSMPEYRWAFAYPLVIALRVTACAARFLDFD